MATEATQDRFDTLRASFGSYFHSGTTAMALVVVMIAGSWTAPLTLIQNSKLTGEPVPEIVNWLSQYGLLTVLPALALAVVLLSLALHTHLKLKALNRAS